MKVLIFGVGNLLLSDEGFGVHFVRYLEERCEFPPEVELFDAGTLGLMSIYKFEETDRVYIIDVVTTKGEPGDCFRYEKEDFRLKRVPLKLSPHQIGIQEMMLVSEMRGCCPPVITLLGVVPASLAPGSSLSAILQRSMAEMSEALLAELRLLGFKIEEKNK